MSQENNKSRSSNVLIVSSDPIRAGEHAQVIRSGVAHANIRWVSPMGVEEAVGREHGRGLAAMVRLSDVVVVDLCDDARHENLIEPIRGCRPEAGVVAIVGNAAAERLARLSDMGVDEIVLVGSGGGMERSSGQVAVAVNQQLRRRVSGVMAKHEEEHSEIVLLRDENAQLRKQVARLESLATTDPLTGLANRRAADERVGEQFSASVRHGWDLACLMIDLDGLKRVNDTLGHGRGDELLRMAAETIRSTIRKSDFAARVGGDEFLVLLPQCSISTASVMAQRLVERFGEKTNTLMEELDLKGRSGLTVGIGDGEPGMGEGMPNRAALSNLKVHVTLPGARGGRSVSGPVGMSIGAASRVEVFASTPEGLVQSADKALYEAKREGRGRLRVVSRDAAVRAA